MHSIVSALERHATGCTIILFLLGVLGLSLAPLPEWLKPLDAFEQDDPAVALRTAIFHRAASGGRKGDAAAGDWAVKHEGTSAEVEEDDTPKPELAIVAPVQRTAWTPPVRAKLDAYRDRLHLSVAPIDNPCVKSSSTACDRHALDRFFDRLARAEEKEAGAVARVVHYGDSIIASDHITDMVRQRLQERFGSAGKGFLLVTRYNDRQRRLRTGNGGKGWRAEHIAQGKLADAYFGYAGAAFTAETAGAETVFDDIGASRFADVYYLAQPSGGAIELYADANLVKTIDTRAPGPVSEASFSDAALPEGTKKLRVRAKDKGVRIFGVALEADVPGVIYESIGVPGTTSEVWMFPDAAGFEKQLRRRDPTLIVTMLGGNDARSLHQKKKTLESIEKSTRAFLGRLAASVPKADCLVISPLDAVEAKANGEMKSKREVQEVIALQKRISREQGCAFWDMYSSMGGAGSLERWFKADLINPDLIHPRALGGDLLGELMAEALMNAFDARMVGKAGVAGAVP